MKDGRNEYNVDDLAAIHSPSLLFYRDIIRRNIETAISIAGGGERLRPHVKTHKTKEISAMAMELGITKFKCATIAEAEMLAQIGAPDVLIAYPLVGPNIERFLALAKTYPSTRLTAVADNQKPLTDLSRAATRYNTTVNIMIDIDPGMSRTGVPFGEEAVTLYRTMCSSPALRAAGLHCYDGHNHQSDPGERKKAAGKCYEEVINLKKTLESRGFPVPTVVMGGTPTFPMYAALPDAEVSPGTFFLHDWGYSTHFPDLPFTPAALLLSRVVSIHPKDSTFTLDLGYKALASDPAGQRGTLFNTELKGAAPLYQNEEHWVWKTEEMPGIGQTIFILPTHICPTVALFSEASIVNGHGEIVGQWPIIARNRRISI